MNIQISQGKCGNGMNRYKGGGIRYSSFSAVHLRMRQWKNNYYQKLSYCWETAKWPSNVLKGHQKWHQSKASVWFPISTLQQRLPHKL